MAVVLSQDEIDKLLLVVKGDDDSDLDFDIPAFSSYPSGGFAGIGAFEAFLTKRKFEPDEPYGNHSFESDITMCRFFESKDGETILADIERKNAE